MAMGRNMRNLQDLRAQMRGSSSEGEEGFIGVPQQQQPQHTAPPVGHPQQQHQYQQPHQPQQGGGGYGGAPMPTTQAVNPISHGGPDQPQANNHSHSNSYAPTSTPGGNRRGAGTGPSGPPPRRFSENQRLEALMREVDPSFRMSPGACEVVVHMIENFMTKVAERAAQVARHRSGSAIEHRDVAFVLLKDWNMSVPGLAPRPSSSMSSQAAPGGGEGRGMKRKGGAL